MRAFFAAYYAPNNAALVVAGDIDVERTRNWVRHYPREEEVEAVQNYLAGTFVLQNSSRAGIVGQLALLDLHGLDEDDLRRYVQRVRALEPRDIQRMARRYLRDEEMTIVVVGDREAIATQVAPFGPVR